MASSDGQTLLVCAEREQRQLELPIASGSRNRCWRRKGSQQLEL